MTDLEMAQKIADWCKAEAIRLSTSASGQGYASGLAAAAMYAAKLAKGEPE